MKKRRVNPTAIGAFVLGSLTIAVLSIILFGSGRWFGGERASFVCFFEDAVDGMQIGSKVKLKGVPIGEVKRILLRFQPQTGEGKAGTKPLIPVIIEVDVERLWNDYGVSMDFREERDYQAQIGDGLRATLGISNLITGILQVNLDYHDDAEPVEKLEAFVYRGERYRVIPTLPSQLAQATNDLLGVVNNISQADFRGVVDGLNELLDKLAGKLDQFEVTGMNEALEAFQARMESPKFDEALVAFSKAADAVAEATKGVQEVANNLNKQLGTDVLGGTVDSAGESFESLTEAVDNLSELIKANEGVPGDLEISIKEIGEMAKSIKELADYLSEHPNSVIFGRKEKDTEVSERPADRERKPWHGGPRG